MNANKYYFGAAKYIPWLLRPVMNIVASKPSGKPLPKWVSGLPKVDHELMTEPKIIKHFTAVTTVESCKRGSKGIVYEAALYFNPFYYKISNIQCPIRFWWGTEDNVVPEIHAKTIENEAPEGKVFYKNNQGHLSIYVHCIEEILATLCNE